jgi:hypothetical protein
MIRGEIYNEKPYGHDFEEVILVLQLSQFFRNFPAYVCIGNVKTATKFS